MSEGPAMYDGHTTTTLTEETPRRAAAKQSKTSYTIPCSSAFRDAITTLADRRGVNAADLARSVVLMLPLEILAAYPDSGEPANEDRETVVLKTGKSKGRPWQRKPRLQVRMAAGYDAVTLRRALAVALDMDRGSTRVLLDAPGSGLPLKRHDREEVARLKTIVSALSFDPLPDGVQTRADALHVLGFAPGSRPAPAMFRARFRALAAIHHPDGEYGSHQRMSQLNSAIGVLRDNT